jgi:hypothetical protein
VADPHPKGTPTVNPLAILVSAASPVKSVVFRIEIIFR